jgi:hypothetical protein
MQLSLAVFHNFSPQGGMLYKLSKELRRPHQEGVFLVSQRQSCEFRCRAYRLQFEIELGRSSGAPLPCYCVKRRWSSVRSSGETSEMA